MTEHGGTVRGTSAAAGPRTAEPPWGLTGRPALLLLASLIVALLAASAAPTPLYAVYQARWGFTPIATTVVFGVYAVAVLASLLTLGKLSDHIGRRPVLLAALAVQVASLAVFATAGSLAALLLARVVQGLATGAALGAIGAGLLDVDRERGTFANAVAPGMGTGSGVLLSALAVRYLPAPTHLIYLALMAVFVLQATGVALLRETVSRKPGAAASLRPEIRLPRTLRGPVLTAAPVLFAVWALAGLYGALGPALVHSLTGSMDVVLGGLSLFVLTAAAVTAIIVLRRAGARTVMLTGILTLITGVAVTMLGLGIKSTPVFFAGTAISGAGFGSGFQGGIRTVVPRAAAHERAGVLSLLYLVSYLGLGLPAVAAGFVIVHGAGLTGTALYYGGAVILLAALALPGLLRTRTRGATGRAITEPARTGCAAATRGAAWAAPTRSREHPGRYTRQSCLREMSHMAVKDAARPSARERLLAAANELFYAEGVHTVGIDRVIEHAGVAKGSLYNTFGSKDELIRAYLEARHTGLVRRITAALERYDTPRERLLGVFEAQRDLFSEPGYRGCAFVRASAESHPGDLVEQAAAAYRGWVRGLFTSLAEEAGVPDPQALARQLHLLYDGSGVSARMDHDPAAATAARSAAAVLLNAALASAGPGAGGAAAASR